MKDWQFGLIFGTQLTTILLMLMWTARIYRAVHGLE